MEKYVLITEDMETKKFDSIRDAIVYIEKALNENSDLYIDDFILIKGETVKLKSSIRVEI